MATPSILPDMVTEQLAISAALNQEWAEAIRINLILLKNDKSNINVLNRLGFAYLQNNQPDEAKKTFQKVVKLDIYNQIAQKNLKKLETMKQGSKTSMTKQQFSPMLFLEEPGKTKIIECVNAAPVATLASLTPGEEVLLNAKNHVVEVRTKDNVYIAALPDDVSFRIIKLLSGGNTYMVLVKSVTKNSVIVFIREITRGKRFSEQPSFATTGIYLPFSRKEERPEGAGEQEDIQEERDSDD